METNDPRLKTEVVDGQVLYFPTPEAWEELKKFPVFGGSGKRAEISATPGGSELYYGCEDKQAARDRGYSYPNVPCPYCRKTSQRRYTIWRAK